MRLLNGTEALEVFDTAARQRFGKLIRAATAKTKDKR
jgi:hypothetical protein